MPNQLQTAKLACQAVVDMIADEVITKNGFNAGNFSADKAYSASSGVVTAQMASSYDVLRILIVGRPVNSASRRSMTSDSDFYRAVDAVAARVAEKVRAAEADSSSTMSDNT